MIYKTRECPSCNSKEIEIEERYIPSKRTNQYTLRCRDCGYTKSQFKPF